MPKRISLLFISILLSACTLAQPKPPITDFDSCVAAGNPVMESYPPRCASGGVTYTQNIGNELELADTIRVSNPRPNQTINSPLTVTGEARGNWYFEASFPIELHDQNNQVIATGIAQAQGEWMTEDFVPFTAELTFSHQPSGTTGSLILKKDNPSGDPALDQQLLVPVKF